MICQDVERCVRLNNVYCVLLLSFEYLIIGQPAERKFELTLVRCNREVLKFDQNTNQTKLARLNCGQC